MRLNQISKRFMSLFDLKTRYIRFRIPILNQLSHRYFSINDIDSQLEKIINVKKGFYCELGANNGIRQSNTAHFEFFKNWHGILIEPYLENYKACKRNRSKRNDIYHAACVSSDFQEDTIELFYLDLMSFTPSTAHQLIDKETHSKNGLKHLQKGHIFRKVRVPALTLMDILISSNAPRNMQLLSLDVEGAELNVLQGLNHEQFRFNYMCIESRDIKELSEYLNKFNYSMVKRLSPHDYLFKDNLLQ